MVTVFVPVAPWAEAPGAGTAVKLNEPETLVEVNVVIVSVPLPRLPAAPQAPVTVLPFEAMKPNVRAPPSEMDVVPTAAGLTAKEMDRVRSALFDATLMVSLMLVAALTMPV